MGTYRNCYALHASLRQALGDYSAAKVAGTDTFGGYNNDYLIEKINAAVRELYALMVRRYPGLFLGESDLVGVNSVFTLPWDFGKLEWFKDNYGRKVHEIGEAQRRWADSDGSKRLYRRVGNTLVLDMAGIGLTYTLVYRKKPRDIHNGTAAGGGALSITLSTSAPKVADYYNGMIVENITKDWIDTISDYSAARVATIAAETAATSDFYGLVPEIPEWSHFLIAPRAALMVRAEHPLVKRKPTNSDYQDYNNLVRTTLLENAGPPGDQEVEELFLDFEPRAGAATY